MCDPNPNAWWQIPFTCIECPIRQVEISCKLNTDCGDWKFWDRRRQKWPIGRSKIENRGLLMELCRKSNCNPEYLRHVLISKGYCADKCVCKHIDRKNNSPNIPLTADCTTYCNFSGGGNYGYAKYDPFPQYVQHYLYKNPNDAKKPKMLERDWLNRLYDLYNSYVGTSPDDELEYLVRELQQRYRQFVYLNQFNNTTANEDFNDNRSEEQPICSNKKESNKRKRAGEENEERQIGHWNGSDDLEAKGNQVNMNFLTEAEQNYYRSRYKTILSQ